MIPVTSDRADGSKGNPFVIYDRDYYISLLLAGTVALPSPYPASGRLSVGIHLLKDAEPEVYLELSQFVDLHRTIVRIILFRELRAAQVWDGPAAASDTPILSARELAPRVLEVAEELAKSPDGACRSDAGFLFRHAILYVPEAAPVLQIVRMGLTAAQSAEDYGASGTWGHGCCLTLDTHKP